MKSFIASLVLALFATLANGQEIKQNKPDVSDIKAKLVLRPNTRDTRVIVQNNMRRPQVHRRQQQMMQQHKKIMHKKMQQIQRRKLHQQQIMQQRKIRQESVRRRQMQQGR